jgi:hypothetical protein
MQDQSPTLVSKISHSASLRDTTTRPDSIENSAASTSNMPYFRSGVMIPTCEADSSKASIRPQTTISGSSRSIIVTLSGVSRFFHIENLENASDEEAIFLFRLFFKLNAYAKILALEGDGKYNRAYQAFLLAAESINGE